MLSSKLTITALIVLVRLVEGHGYIKEVIINSQSSLGYDVTKFPYMPTPPDGVVGWATQAKDLGFVDGSKINSPDMICHNGATNANASATIEAGQPVSLVWNTWPDSHKGPIIDYLANCNGDCQTVDKNTLAFFKIAEAGLVDGSKQPTTWATDDLLRENLTWTTTIPAGLAPGNYVLRHEIIALHSAGQENGAQPYPQCINLQVTGSGTETPGGVPATELYQKTDPGIKVNIYTTMTEYAMPGPAIAIAGGRSAAGI